VKKHYDGGLASEKTPQQEAMGFGQMKSSGNSPQCALGSLIVLSPTELNRQELQLDQLQLGHYFPDKLLHQTTIVKGACQQAHQVQAIVVFIL
jgi:hypothetical protein